MRRPVILLLAASLTLAACSGWGNSRLNPGNWFGKSRELSAEDIAAGANPLLPAPRAFERKAGTDGHVPVTTVTELTIERTLTGAILRASGIAARQGAYAARLTPITTKEDAEKGILSYALEVIYPVNPRPVGSEPTRTVLVAKDLSNQDLQGVRLIRVSAAGNSRETRRR
jgi:hypothetical protein